MKFPLLLINQQDERILMLGKERAGFMEFTYILLDKEYDHYLSSNFNPADFKSMKEVKILVYQE